MPVDAKSLGQAGLTGWRRAAAERVAAPIAGRTRLSFDTVLAVLGAVSLVLTLRRLPQVARNLRESR